MIAIVDHPISAEKLRTRVINFENEQLKKHQIPLKVVHHFMHGVVARELHIPAGIELTGAIHLYPNPNILAQGEMLVTTENGIEHVKAPFAVISPAGTKRAAKTLTDCVWTTYLMTFETDIEKIIKLFTTNDEQVYLSHIENLKIKGA